MRKGKGWCPELTCECKGGQQKAKKSRQEGKKTHLRRDSAAFMFSLSETQTRILFTCSHTGVNQIREHTTMPSSFLIRDSPPPFLPPSLPSWALTLICPSRLQHGSFRL